MKHVWKLQEAPVIGSSGCSFFFLKDIIRELPASEGKLRWAPAGGCSTANCGKCRLNVIYHISINNILLFYDHFLILLLLLEKINHIISSILPRFKLLIILAFMVYSFFYTIDICHVV